MPVDFLKGLGLADCKYLGQSAVRVPYYGEDGSQHALRYRLALSHEAGKRFVWRKGDRAMPYGLNRLGHIRKAGWVLVAEGESDCWTCWLHGVPALGAPGKGIWPHAWGEYIKGLDVYVWQEPDAEDFVLRVLSSASALRFIIAPDGFKDISDAHMQSLDIPVWLESLKDKAESGQALKERLTNAQLAQLHAEAQHIIEAEDPLKLVEVAIRNSGYGGDTKPAMVTYLAATSRLLEMRVGSMPVHLLLMGPSSAGKSYTLNTVKSLLPIDACHIVDAGSPRTIIYDDASLEHRVLIFGEADSLPAGEDNPAASAVRNLLQDHRLHYSVTIRDEETGNFTVREVDKPGPTVMVTTSTRPLGTQLMTRLFVLEVSDSPQQIGAALRTQADIEVQGVKMVDPGLLAFQAYLQLKAPVKVVVPFAPELADALGKASPVPRMSRDFARLISLVKTVALVRHHHRRVDQQGRIVATHADWETVRNLVNDMYLDSSSGATTDIRSLVETVKRLCGERRDAEKITNSRLAKALGIGEMQALRRAQKAKRHGWIVNNELRKSHPADYAPGEPMPEVDGLPSLRSADKTGNDDADEPVGHSEFTNDQDNRITDVTDERAANGVLEY